MNDDTRHLMNDTADRLGELVDRVTASGGTGAGIAAYAAGVLRTLAAGEPVPGEVLDAVRDAAWSKGYDDGAEARDGTPAAYSAAESVARGALAAALGGRSGSWDELLAEVQQNADRVRVAGETVTAAVEDTERNKAAALADALGERGHHVAPSDWPRMLGRVRSLVQVSQDQAMRPSATVPRTYVGPTDRFGEGLAQGRHDMLMACTAELASAVGSSVPTDRPDAWPHVVAMARQAIHAARSVVQAECLADLAQALGAHPDEKPEWGAFLAIVRDLAGVSAYPSEDADAVSSPEDEPGAGVVDEPQDVERAALGRPAPLFTHPDEAEQGTVADLPREWGSPR